MKPRMIAPGENPSPEEDPARRFAQGVNLDDVREGVPLDGYLDDPLDLDDPLASRRGICCSGGGIRATSYALGALQVLRERHELANAAHLAAVSGGDYMAVAQHILVSETLTQGDTCPETPEDLKPVEGAFFGALAPWAPMSPEEQNLRDHTTYLAAGLAGKAWMGLNLVYGMVRHMIPFGAGITAAGILLGLTFQGWIGPVLRLHHGASGPPVRDVFIALAVAVAALGAASAIVLSVRQWVGKRWGNTAWLRGLRAAATALLGLEAAVVILGMGLPAVLLLVHAQTHLISPASKATAGAAAAGGSLGVMAFLGRLAKRGVTSPFAKKLLPKLMPVALALLGPVVVAVPLAATAYYGALRGNDLGHPTWWHLPWTAWLIGLPVVVLVVYWLFLDEVTSSIHLFYRERLSTVFTGLRKIETVDGEPRLRFGQPPWRVPIRFSKECLAKGPAKLPNLVVCAAVNVSDDVLPPGRLAGSFTFERDFSGGPLTGYVPTSQLEDAAGRGVLTLPAMMAISGAAVSPSMGKMTRPWARFLLALFNARLGVWLPNPLRIGRFGPWEASLSPTGVRQARSSPPTAAPRQPGEGEAVQKPLLSPTRRAFRPGTGYVLREALGLNHLGKNYVYTTDGGHWDNLGLVELLRRGCGLILCFDAAGDDLDHFHTLSEAIELARSDLGVEIFIDLEDLKPQEDDPGKFSKRACVPGCIKYPQGTLGLLLFAKAAITKDTPRDALDWRDRDPRFPTNSTLDQWFSDRQFESYRALGAFAAHQALRELDTWKILSPAERRAKLEDLCP